MPANFKQVPPISETVTDYDQACLKLYLILLDAESSGANWIETHKRAFGLLPKADLGCRLEQYQAHLKRARWMTEFGYKQLIQDKN